RRTITTACADDSGTMDSLGEVTQSGTSINPHNPGAPFETTPGAYPCRFCGALLHHTFVDLGMSPLCESYVSAVQLHHMQPFYPLHVYVCDQCFLVQLPEHVSPEHIFRHYAYFPSYSDTWLEHARKYTEMATKRFHLDGRSQVVEIASNDGYLLQY